MGAPVSVADDAGGVPVRLVLTVPDRCPRSQVQAEARVREKDQEVREEGAEEGAERAQAAHVLEEVGEGRRRRVHEPEHAAQVPEVVRPLRLIAAPPAFQTLRKRGTGPREIDTRITKQLI